MLPNLKVDDILFERALICIDFKESVQHSIIIVHIPIIMPIKEKSWLEYTNLLLEMYWYTRLLEQDNLYYCFLLFRFVENYENR